MYDDKTIVLGGVRHHYLDWGNPEAPPLLLVHGLTSHGHVFDPLAARLRERFHVLALDVRGRGESDWAPPESYAIPTYVKDVLALLDQLEIPAVHYLGTSMGGLLGMTLAAQAPQRLLSVVVNDIGPVINPAGMERIASRVGRKNGSYATVEEYVDHDLLSYFYFLKDRPRQQLVDQARWYLRQNEDGTYRAKYDPAIGGGTSSDPEALQKAAKFFWSAWGSITCPLMLIRGAESDLLSPETARAMGEAQPGMKMVEVPGASHAPFLDEPAALAALDGFYGQF